MRVNERIKRKFKDAIQAIHHITIHTRTIMRLIKILSKKKNIYIYIPETHNLKDVERALTIFRTTKILSCSYIAHSSLYFFSISLHAHTV